VPPDSPDADKHSLTWSVCLPTSKRYDVRRSEPLLRPGNLDLLTGAPVPGRRFVVCDDGVLASWRHSLARYLEAHDVVARIMVVPGGEQSKQPSTLFELLEAFADFGLDRRNEPVIIVGGGAVMDVASFAAAIYRRGVPFIKVPTTVLGYVDAAIGIKTAINFNNTKNLVGSFSAPTAVLLDRGFFASLPGREISSGLSEIMKLAIGCDAPLFSDLETLTPDVVFGDKFRSLGSSVLFRAIEVIIRELEPNILEDDLHRPLDLGHTFSQVFEMVCGGDGAPRHGEAVALDLNLSCVIAARRRLLDRVSLQRVAKLSEALGMPTKVPAINSDDLWRSVVERTQHRGGLQRIPLPKRLGACIFVNDLTAREINEAFEYLVNAHWR
jgi:2-epi-5-epi-valiolone synthase